MIEGLTVTNGFLSEAEESELVDAVSAEVPPEVLRGAQLHGRSRIERYGPGVAASGYTTAHRVEPVIPPAVRKVCAMVSAEIAGFVPNAITVAWYLPGDIVSPHVDRSTCGEIIAVVSLLSDVMQRFRTRERVLVADVLVPRRSLTVLRGTARWEYLHEIWQVTSPRIALVMRQAQG